MQKDLAYWVALASDGQIGAKTFAKLLARFETIEEVWMTSYSMLLESQIPKKFVDIILEIRKNVDPSEELEKLKKLNIKCVTIKDKNYPRLLKEIPDSPALLYYKGELKSVDEISLAVVGSRKYSDYGRQTTFKITRELSEAGLVIISGLALGIDSFAHLAALDVNSRTIAVLANGLDSIYPLAHYGLAKKILDKGGAIISEFPPGTPALRYNFPVRNRIIAGLSLGTLVVEGALQSGSLITARCALDYNREVFAIPGDIRSKISEGPNYLIKSGAKLVTDSQDVIEELNLDVKIKTEEAKKIIPDSHEEEIILGFLEKDKPIHVDKLSKVTKLDIKVLNSKLSLMEIKGKIRNIGASNYLLGH